MSSPQSSNKHAQWLDEALVRNPGDPAETADAELWDTPGRDGIVSEDAGDPDRTDLRSAIGRHVSLVSFPARGADLLQVARDGDAPDPALDELGRLDPDEIFDNPTELWDALGLGSHRRF